MPIRHFSGIGIMSGSSLDGLDLAHVHFEVEDGRIFNWSLHSSRAVPFNEGLRERLRLSPNADALSFCTLDHDFGDFIGRAVMDFIKEGDQSVDFVASHGHTVFHFPERGFSTQIGNAASIRAKCGLKVINDFRSSDVAYGGEGAPLAPVVEKYLYGDHDFYLNLGGIANLSYHADDEVLACDVCPANQLLNALAAEQGKAYDDKGGMAKAGNLASDLFNRMKKDPFLMKQGPKSLDNTYVKEYYLPLIGEETMLLNDRLHTCVHFIAQQIAKQIDVFLEKASQEKTYTCLMSGGGVFNAFLVQQIEAYSPRVKFVIPAKEVIAFKESILMALLGLLRLLEKPNSFSSVTGASEDTINGAVYF